MSARHVSDPARHDPTVEEEDDEEDDEEYEDEDDEEEEEGDEDYVDMAGLLSNLLATEDDNVCTAMLKVSKQLETTNKILVKMLSQLSKKSEA